jgi:hypothetical protein
MGGIGNICGVDGGATAAPPPVSELHSRGQCSTPMRRTSSIPSNMSNPSQPAAAAASTPGAPAVASHISAPGDKLAIPPPAPALVSLPPGPATATVPCTAPATATAPSTAQARPHRPAPKSKQAVQHRQTVGAEAQPQLRAGRALAAQRATDAAPLAASLAASRDSDPLWWGG